MLAASPWSWSSNYMPTRPSPLSPRSANVQFPTFANMSHSLDAKKPTRFSSRQVKANPILQSRDAATARRRDLFHKKVQQERDEKRWEGRGEQILHLQYVSEQRRYEAEKERDAPSVEDEIDDDDNLLPQLSQEPPHNKQLSNHNPQQQFKNIQRYMLIPEEDELEALLEQEDQELEALVALMEEGSHDQENAAMASHFGSDIDDYDEIFSEYLSSQAANSTASFDVGMDDIMDTSEG